jgi:DNA-binding beta-propeller fold protein YncE
MKLLRSHPEETLALRESSTTIIIGSGRVSGITVTRDNKIFAVGEWSGVTEVDIREGTIRKQFALPAPKGVTPGKASHPYAIASDSKGRLYVSEVQSKTVQICDADGKLLSTLDPGFGDPRGLAVAALGGKLCLAVADFAKRCVWVLELSDTTLQILDTQRIADERVPLCTAFDAAGRLYVGTQSGIDRFEAGKRTGHWQSQFNAKGHQVWGVAIRGDLLVCSEGSDNEKHWMKATLADFKPAQ